MEKTGKNNRIRSRTRKSNYSDDNRDLTMDSSKNLKDLEESFIKSFMESFVPDFIEESSEHDEVISDILLKAFKEYQLNLPDKKKFELFQYNILDEKKFDALSREIWIEAYDYAIEYYINNYSEDYDGPSKRAISLFLKKIIRDFGELRAEFWNSLITNPKYLKKIEKFCQNNNLFHLKN